MDNRIRDIEGSRLENVSKYLVECVVKKDIKYVYTPFHKKGIITKAELVNNKLYLTVSNGFFYQGLVCTISLFILFICIVVSIID
jgi:hypothetical protein